MHLSPAVDADKVGNGAIVGAFSFWRKEAAGQFSHPPVILQAFAAFALARAGFVGASALCQICKRSGGGFPR
jgi:hypothetical protein